MKDYLHSFYKWATLLMAVCFLLFPLRVKATSSSTYLTASYPGTSQVEQTVLASSGDTVVPVLELLSSASQLQLLSTTFTWYSLDGGFNGSQTQLQQVTGFSGRIYTPESVTFTGTTIDRYYKLTITGALSFEALFHLTVKDHYDIAFDPCGGTVSPTSGATGADAKLTSLPTPDWNGHTFLGWYTAASGGSPVSSQTVFTTDCTIYAHWDNPSTGGSSTTTPGSGQESQGSTDLQTVTQTPAQAVDYLGSARKMLNDAITLGGKQTMYWSEGTALPYDIMKTLQDHPELTLIFSYTYQDRDYRVVLSGAKVETDTQIPWYGPLYLYGHYGDEE